MAGAQSLRISVQVYLNAKIDETRWNDCRTREGRRGRVRVRGAFSASWLALKSCQFASWCAAEFAATTLRPHRFHLRSLYCFIFSYIKVPSCLALRPGRSSVCLVSRAWPNLNLSPWLFFDAIFQSIPFIHPFQHPYSAIAHAKSPASLTSRISRKGAMTRLKMQSKSPQMSLYTQALQRDHPARIYRTRYKGQLTDYYK